jgi:predicted cupin superfamily sugar epimerase
MQIDELVQYLNLLPHPEGGFYRETYRSDAIIPLSALSGDYSGDRHVATGIYFLLTGTNFSAFHRIVQDEMWHFYSGKTLLVHVIEPSGRYQCHRVGMNLQRGELPQLVVKGGCWFASEVDSLSPEDYALVGCTVAPGFDFADFELAQCSELCNHFPAHQEVIKRLTRS